MGQVLNRDNSKNSANFGRSSQNSNTYAVNGVDYRASHGSSTNNHFNGVASSASFAPKTAGSGGAEMIDINDQELNDEL